MNDSYNRQATVVTSEHVRLQLTMAGLGSRAAALLIDTLLMLAGLGAVSLILSLILMMMGMNIGEALGEYVAAFLILFGFFLFGAYYIVMEYYRAGQTYGKKWMGLRVIQENGQPLTFLSAAIRTFFRLIDFLPSFYILGAFWMFFHPRDRRLGDLAAGTVVVRDMQHERMQRNKRTQKWLSEWRAKWRVSMDLPESLHSRMEREDWQLLSTFVERMPTLDKQKEYELAGKLAYYLGDKLNLDRNAYVQYPAAFLVELYAAVHKEWSL